MSDPMSPRYFLTVTPYIVVKDAHAAIAFYEKALGAKSREVSLTPDGKVMNAQLVIGDSVLMLNDEFPDYGSFGPTPGAQMPFTLHIQATDISAQWQQAVDAGMEVTMPLELQFWGDHYGQLRCPFGYQWSMGQPADAASA